ncbi:MAG TPA: NnrU family protein [Pseudomonadales bacterium]|nr:NnrU family protein [Pseudomonadales bacterium]
MVPVTLLLGLVLFLGIHSISIFAQGLRDRLAARSEIGWKLAFTVLSLVGLVLVVQGYGAARMDPIQLWVPPSWTRHVAAVLLLPVFVLFFASAFPGRIRTAAKHPQLLAVKLWATAHLLANGTLADVLLFGAFLAWAVAERISLKRRTQRPVPTAPPGPLNDAIVVVLGLATYGVFVFWAHAALIGVAPFA